MLNAVTVVMPCRAELSNPAAPPPPSSPYVWQGTLRAVFSGISFAPQHFVRTLLYVLLPIEWWRRSYENMIQGFIDRRSAWCGGLPELL